MVDIMNRPARLLFYSLQVVHYCIILTVRHHIEEIPEMKRRSFGGPWKFLTYLNLWIQGIYAFLAVASEVLEILDRRKRSKKATTDFVFSALAFPAGVFTSVIFWTLFLVDRELVFPAKLDKVFPPWSNHMMHTTPVVAQMIDMIFVHHSYPKRKVGMLAFCLFCLAYVVWIFVIAYYGGFWVYPVLKVLSVPGKAIFIIVCMVMACALYLGGEGLNHIMWGSKATVSAINKEEDFADVYNLSKTVRRRAFRAH